MKLKAKKTSTTPRQKKKVPELKTKLMRNCN
jgi:hypothetical protein